MAEVGYSPANITYFAISHGHGDHTANANDFQGSTWLVNKAEYDAMFAEKAPRFYTPATYSALKTSKNKFIDGDYDVFGDGTVVIKQTPGHTAGHQVLLVKLAGTGTIALTGDLYHYPEEVNLQDGRAGAGRSGDHPQVARRASGIAEEERRHDVDYARPDRVFEAEEGA